MYTCAYMYIHACTCIVHVPEVRSAAACAVALGAPSAAAPVLCSGSVPPSALPRPAAVGLAGSPALGPAG